MVEITVSDVSEDVIACLVAQAQANHRSLESEVRGILVQHTRVALAWTSSASARRNSAL